jgi:hypothetical protein
MPKETSRSDAPRLRLIVSSSGAEMPRVFEVALPPASDEEEIGRAVERAASAFGRTLLDALDEERQRPRAA